VNNGQSAAISNPSITQWFNTSVFTTAAPYTFGNVGPVLPDVRTDWTRNIDTVLTKNFGFAIAEKKISRRSGNTRIMERTPLPMVLSTIRSALGRPFLENVARE
jgi:hypothetical protein